MPGRDCTKNQETDTPVPHRQRTTSVIIRSIIFLLFLLSGTSASALEVLVSVRPLQLIVSEIMGPNAKVTSLIDARQSPHHFQLKPSQLHKLARAEMVIWISNHFEVGLARLYTQLPQGDARLELATRVPAEQLIGRGSAIDGHLWLSPNLMQDAIPLIVTQLARHDPGSADRYRRNATELIKNIDTWKKRYQASLGSADPSYILDHSFLAYFERDLGLHNRGSLRNAHDNSGSMRGLSKLHTDLGERKARCLLVDRLPANRQALQIAQEHKLEIKPLHLLGQHESIASIVDLYRHIGDTLLSCAPPLT